MKRLTATWTTALATAALLSVPVVSSAQTPQTTPPEPQPSQSTTLSKPATQDASPAEHLRQAKEALAGIDAATVPAGAKSQIAALNRHINALERSVAADDKASATGTAQRSPKASSSVNWANDVAAIDRIITQLAGTASATGTGEAGTVGTSGTEPRTTTKSKSTTALTLDEPSRNKLMEVRTHITAFAAAMSGTSSSPAPSSASQPSATAAPPAASTATPAQQPAPSPTPSAAAPTASPTEPTTPTSSATGQTSTTGQPGSTPEQTDTTAAQQAKVDAEAAKQHLTAARETLTQLTQLPAASQLQGDARTQVSQLIQNFNELITTQADWRAAYGKLEANLNTLIGPAPSARTGEAPATAPATPPETTPPATAPSNPPAAPPANPPAGTQGTQGTQGTPEAVGTSGTATVTLDPAIRQKLVEFRTHLLAFHTAAGGDAK